MTDHEWKPETRKIIEKWNEQNIKTARAMAYENARARIKVDKLVLRVQSILDRLEAFSAPVQPEILFGKEPAAPKKPVTKETLLADKIQLDGLFKMLNKVMPDLKAVEHSGSVERRNVHELSDAELSAIARGRSLVAAGEEDGEGAPAVVQ